MANKRASRQKTKQVSSSGRQKAILVFSLILILTAVCGVWARRSSLPWPITQEIPDTFSPTNPAKEYVYAGGKLVATEEPVGTGCTYSINPASQNFQAGGGPGSVAVTTQSGCAWTATSNAGFITITSGGSGSGSGTVNFSVQQNTITSPRTGTLTIAGQTFTVTQDAAVGSCTYSISPTSQNFQASGGIGSVTVTTQSGCAWSATSNASFVTITSGSSGSGNGTVSFSVAQNTITSPRSGTMTVAGQTFTVTQSAATGSCTYSINPTSQNNVAASGGTGNVAVTTQSGCAWTATSNASFLTITSGSSGTGNGTVNYSVQQNTLSSSRTGTLTIAGQTFTVTQLGAGASGAPSVPTNLVATAGISGTTRFINLTWDHDGINLGGFKLDRKLGTNGTYSQLTLLDPTSRSYLNNKLPAGTTYCYRIRAFNSNGESLNSNEACATTP